MYSIASIPNVTIGLDVGDKVSEVCELSAAGEITRRFAVSTSEIGVQALFAGRERCRVVMEAGTHSPWMSRQMMQLGHEVVVANPTKLYVKGRRKSDYHDAELLARLGRSDVRLLWPIRHRSEQVQQDLEVIRAREQLVGARSKLICHVRGAAKTYGTRVRTCSSESFVRTASEQLPATLLQSVKPILVAIRGISRQIAAMDRKVVSIAARYPATRLLQQVGGVGPLTALTFVLLVEDPERFGSNREAGAFMGLVPKLYESGGSKPQLRISKAGDRLGRTLLISAAQYILGPFGPECDLRRFGLALTERGGKNAKKRAAVAVARKLAVLLLSLWRSGATYDPDRLLKQRTA